MCEHGWHSEADCDVCTGRRVAPALSDRVDQLEAALVALIDAVDSGDKAKIDAALLVGRGLTF